MRRDLVVDLPITVDRADPRRLPVQVADAVRALIGAGTLQPGDHLPSTRAVAAGLALSRGTVLAAFDQLQAEGYLVAAHGSGTVVNPRLQRLHSTPVLPPPPSSAAPSTLVDLHPGVPDTSALADSTWRAAWREPIAEPAGTADDPLGAASLRDQIAEHLRQMRGLITRPERIAVTGGARAGLAELLGLLSDHHEQLSVGVESPGYPSLRRVPTALRHRTVDLPTDTSGLSTAALPDRLDAVLVTPSHQYPYGGTLSAERRAQLVSWARTHDSVIIEDDFDSELRHVGQPVAALTALAPDRTVLLGSFSSVLTRAVSCGYLVLPDTLVEPFTRARQALGQPVAAIVQGALARYLATGALRRRTQRLRHVYRRRRGIVVDLLGSLPGARLQPIDGGLQAVLVCEADEAALVAGCAAHGVGVVALSRYWGGQGAGRGLVLGFGAHDDSRLITALRAVARVVRGAARPG